MFLNSYLLIYTAPIYFDYFFILIAIINNATVNILVYVQEFL